MKKIFLFLFVSFFAFSSKAQTYNMGNLGTISNVCSGTFYDSGGPSANYGNNQNFVATFCAPAGQYLQIIFTDFNVEQSDKFYIYDGPDTNAAVIGIYYGTPGSNGAPDTIFSHAGSCITFHFKSNSATTNTGWLADMTCMSTPPPAYDPGAMCSTSLPFCSGTTYNFPNTVGRTGGIGGGGMFGCVYVTPNPVWYYMQIQDPGNLDLTISQISVGGSPIDVDFVLWGPFDSLSCGQLADSTIVDCSFSASYSELANITNAQAGEYYVLLMTNYSGAHGYITLSQIGGTGSTNCGLLRPFHHVDLTVDNCDSLTGQYALSGQLFFQYTQKVGDLVISHSLGQSDTIPGPWTDPVSFNFNNLPADGLTDTISVFFTADPARVYRKVYSAPASCLNPVGLQNKEATSPFSIFPNPTDRLIHIRSLNTHAWITIQVFNIYGKEVLRLPFAETVDMKELENGIYSFVLTNEDGIRSKQKIVKNTP